MTPSETIAVFDGSAQELRVLLETGARARPGKWERVRLSTTKALVALRISVLKRQWQLVIGHDVAPQTFMGKARREQEVVQLQRELGFTGAQRGADTFEGEAIAATFSVPLSPEVRR